MAIIKELKGDTPVIGKRAFLAETATIIGNVEIGTTAAYGTAPYCAGMSALSALETV